MAKDKFPVGVTLQQNKERLANQYGEHTPTPSTMHVDTRERWEPGHVYHTPHLGLRVEISAYRVFADGSRLPYTETMLIEFFGLAAE